MAGYTPPTIWFSKPSATSLFIGTESVINNTTGSPVNVGFYAGRLNTAGSPVNVGLYAGENGTTGSPVNVGSYAGRLNTMGDPVNVGSFTGRLNTTGSPVNVGFYAGENGTTGNPVNIGRFAGRMNTTGSPVNVGFYAGENGTTGDSTMVGLETGRYATDGTGFCLFGKYAGRALTTGSSNVSIFGEVPGEVGMTNTLILGTGSVTRFRYDETNGYQFPSASATAGTITPTHTVTLSFNGTKYKIPCVAA